MEITKILIDGEFPETDLVTVLLEQNSIRDGTDKTVMLDDISTSYLQWTNINLVTGTQVLEIKTRKVINEFEISYWRPRYAPGWRILLDDEEVVKETANRGSDSTPSPATFTYDVLPPSYSPPSIGDCVSGYFEAFASDGGTALCMYAYGSSSLCATNGAGENDEVCANTYTSGDFLWSHSCRVNGAWDEVCIANLCLSSELCTGYQKSVTGTTYWLQGGSGSQASYSNSNYKCCRKNLPG
jgi:hypothetical protein